MNKLDKVKEIAYELAKRKMSYYKLSLISEISQPTIKRILSGKTENPNERTIDALYKALFESNVLPSETKVSYDIVKNPINPDFIKINRKRKRWNQHELANKLGVNVNTIVNWENSKNPIPESKHSLIRQILEPRVSKTIPFYDIDVTATNIMSFEDYPEISSYQIDFKDFNDCVAALPVVGDSMYPEFKNGDIIAIKPAPTTHYEYGAVHVIITTEGFRTIKRLRKHKNASKVILQPSNDRFDEAVISKEDISTLYLVKGQFKKHTY